MPSTRRLTAAAPVTATLAVVVAGAALLFPGVRHTLSTSFTRTTERYVALYFPDPTQARACGSIAGRLTVHAALDSHLASDTTLPWLVTVSRAGTITARTSGSVATSPDTTSAITTSVRVPSGVYTVAVTLPGRPEHLSLHCAGSGDTGANR